MTTTVVMFRHAGRKKVLALDRQQKREHAKVADANTFKTVAEDCFKKQKTAESTRVRDGRILGYLCEEPGARPVAEIDAANLLAAVEKIEARGAHETAHRVNLLTPITPVPYSAPVFRLARNRNHRFRQQLGERWVLAAVVTGLSEATKSRAVCDPLGRSGRGTHPSSSKAFKAHAALHEAPWLVQYLVASSWNEVRLKQRCSSSPGNA